MPLDFSRPCSCCLSGSLLGPVAHSLGAEATALYSAQRLGVRVSFLLVFVFYLETSAGSILIFFFFPVHCHLMVVPLS